MSPDLKRPGFFILFIVLLAASSACSPEQRPDGADRFGEDRVVYQAAFGEVVQAASDALFDIGLEVEGSTTIDEGALVIKASKLSSAGGGRHMQVASMQVFVNEIAPSITEVRVRMQDSRGSGGLVASGAASYPTRIDFGERLFTELNKQYTIAEVEQVPHEQP